MEGKGRGKGSGRGAREGVREGDWTPLLRISGYATGCSPRPGRLLERRHGPFDDPSFLLSTAGADIGRTEVGVVARKGTKMERRRPARRVKPSEVSCDTRSGRDDLSTADMHSSKLSALYQSIRNMAVVGNAELWKASGNTLYLANEVTHYTLHTRVCGRKPHSAAGGTVTKHCIASKPNQRLHQQTLPRSVAVLHNITHRRHYAQVCWWPCYRFLWFLYLKSGP